MTAPSRKAYRVPLLVLGTLTLSSLMLLLNGVGVSSLLLAVLLARPASAALGCRGEIGALVDRIAALPPQPGQLCQRLYRVSARASSMVIPQTFAPKVVRWVTRDGQSSEESLAAVRHQTAVVVSELTHGQEAHFNPLRASKPVAFQRGGAELGAFAEIASSAGAGCDFCSPAEKTGAESWGRIHGRHSVTAANAFRADGAHGLLIFSRHDPLAVSLDELADGLEVIERWLHRTAAEASRAEPTPAEGGVWWPLVWWNALHKSSASQIHAHAQMILSPAPVGRTSARAHERNAYAAAHSGADYWADLAQVHLALGLGIRVGAAHVLASLTPHVPAGEIVVVGDEGAPLAALAAPIHVALRALTEHRGCRSFSLVFEVPPFSLEVPGAVRPAPRSEGFGDGNVQRGARVIATLLDRGGDLDARTADVGGVDLVLGSTIANADPFALAEAIARASGEPLQCASSA